MPWNEWLQLDHHFPKYHAIKVDRMANQGSKVVRTEEAKLGVPAGTLAGKWISLYLPPSTSHPE